MPAAHAQSDDTLMLMSRMNDLESQLQALQQGHAATKGSNGALPGGPAAADLDVQLGQLQDQIRTLTGQLETQENEIAQLKANDERIQADMQQRLSDLESGGPRPTGGAVPAVLPPPAQSTAPGAGAPVPLTGPTALAPQSETLGTLGGSPAGSGSPEKDYETAYNLLGSNDYAGAQAGFQAFLQHYPKHPLAANAQYWLGETYYARNEFPQATSTFAESYKLYPNGAKAPDSLLKLGMSLGQQGQAQQACLSFAELAKQFPAASAKIKATMGQQRALYKCQ